ncbi:MAG: DNA polymerase III subunit gamma and tau [Actinobacteria bacterium]|nr:DNA polymerase III subunit gamma and tau [Actinomycetota bacterium]MDA2982352.1 DNA polymerase III subunit gamma and tau [Actinomycetota bacterium]MDA2996915.1 DNA polymerase III subunit gamma and tau [Actinomycetota bacterium]
MSLALYRKYRPSTFSEVIGQEHVTEPLSNALESGKIHHAYLFSGPRGCGKTSSARIMARSLNCEKGPTPNPCGQCQSCKDLVANGPGSIDVIELDAATHGLVDDARDLRDKAFFAPVSSRYKIYIIDEAHQLGPGAANALLKVVEEPPPHVLFIFATTEPEKLISTIRSRTHHYPFRLVPPGILATHLEKVCESEGIKVAKGVIPLVVRASGGSVRDALSVLGQLLAGAGKSGVTYEIAIQLLGYTDGALLGEAIDAMAARDGATLFKAIDRVIESGHDPRRFTQDFLERLRDLIIVGAVEESASQILREIPEDQLQRMRAQASIIGTANLIRSADIVAAGLTQMRGATAPRLMLELICGRILLPGSDDIGLISRIERLELRENISVPQPVAAKVEVPKSAPVKESAKEIVKEEAKAPIRAAAPTPNAKKPTGPIDAAALRRFWPDVIENVKKRRRLTWSLLSSSAHVLSVDDNAITIGIVNAGARDSFTRSGSEEILRAAFVDVTGLDLKIECVVDASTNSSAPSARTSEDPSDADQMSGQELLMRELGAQIISETKKD